MVAKTPSTVTTKRRGASELSTMSVSRRICESGCVGSTARTASRIAAESRPASPGARITKLMNGTGRWKSGK